MLWKVFQNGLIVIGLAGLGVGCTSSPATTAQPAAAPAQSTRVFDSPEAAVRSLVDALRTHDTDQLRSIFRPDDDEIISSGDPVADQVEIDRFLTAYDTKHYLQSDLAGGVVLYVGEQDWPFPVPIKNSGGGYVFDSATGKEEILNRRIGRNELSAEQVCLAIVDAQRDYVAMRPMGGDLPVYARKLVSDAGTKNGLYWPTKEDEPASPLGPLVAYATREGYGSTTRTSSEEPPPYHGYRYRLLTKQGPHANGGAMDYEVDGKLIGGFAVVAYPADYGNSGITTFVTNHDGVVYERDLGPDTEQVAQQMTEFDPGPGWVQANDSPKDIGDD
jgi:hypothetical protein